MISYFERNAKITADYLAGSDLRELSKSWGLSRRQLRWILSHYGKISILRRPPAPPRLTPAEVLALVGLTRADVRRLLGRDAYDMTCDQREQS